MLRKMLTVGAIAMTIAAGSASADDNELHQPWDDIIGTYVVESDDGLNRFD